jgi:hypothetical protein
MATAQQLPTSDAAPPVPVLTTPAPGTGSYLALGGQIGTYIDVQTPTGDNGILGTEAAYGSFYVSGRAVTSTPIGKIYQFDAAGNLIGSFPQNQSGTPSLWGHRDLASDGDGARFNLSPLGGRLWGGQEGGVFVRYTLDASGAPDAGTLLPVTPGLVLIRALGRIGPGANGDVFVTADYTGPIMEFDEGGNLLGTFGNPGEAFYGFAISPTNSNKMWGSSQSPPLVCNGNPGTATQVHLLRMTRFDPGMTKPPYTPDPGFDFCGGLPGGIAGGLGIFDGGSVGINSGFHTFLVVHQAGRDSLSLYDTAEVAGTVTTQFCTAKTTSFCGAASMTAVGTSSATATNGFQLAFGPTRGCRAGLVLYSNQPTVSGIPFGGPGDGLLCLTPGGLRRAGPIDSGGTAPSVCDGNMSVDMNAFNQFMYAAVGCNPAAGQNNPAGFLSNMGTTVSAQGWGRDSVATGQVLSDGRQWVVGP